MSVVPAGDARRLRVAPILAALPAARSRFPQRAAFVLAPLLIAAATVGVRSLLVNPLDVGEPLGNTGLLVAVPALATLLVVRRILIDRIYEGHGVRRAPRDRALVLRVPVPQGGVLVPPGPPPDVRGLTVAQRLPHTA